MNSYYLNLIDWSDPEDPIRKLIIPDKRELDAWNCLDPSNEEKYTKVPGLQHKYQDTALLLVNDVCGAYCRFCFRKRIFMDQSDETTRDISDGLVYIREHKEINNVLLTGGDPLVLSTPRLEAIIEQLRDIDHVNVIRIGSKIPAVNPFRILNDPGLPAMFARHSGPDKKIYLMTQFNHPRELTKEAMAGVEMILKSGTPIVNQTPMLKGINDCPDVLGELLNKLSFSGVSPYYIFQCRPVHGNRHFSVPLEEGYEIYERARMKCSGLAKRVTMVMSHSTGKIMMVGKTDDHVYFRYHRAANPQERHRFMVFKSNPDARWFDDYRDFVEEYRV